MTQKQLEIEAQKKGYSLVKINTVPKLLPCLCGNKFRKTVQVAYPFNGEYLICTKCGLKSPVGRGHKQAVENWNKLINQYIHTESE